MCVGIFFENHVPLFISRRESDAKKNVGKYKLVLLDLALEKRTLSYREKPPKRYNVDYAIGLLEVELVILMDFLEEEKKKRTFCEVAGANSVLM